MYHFYEEKSDYDKLLAMSVGINVLLLSFAEGKRPKAKLGHPAFINMMAVLSTGR
jgi:hypothetical protein